MRSRACVLILVVLSACTQISAKEASLILLNAKVWTENPAQPTAQAVALDGSTILAVGSDAEIRKLAGPDTRVLDLGGRLLLPGFNDAHVHFLGGGESLIVVQLRDTKSQAEFRERIAQFARTLPSGAWIHDGVWDHQSWNPPQLPNHQLIDGVTGDHPAFLWRIDGHMALANVLAMKLAGIDRNTKDPPGGEIVRDSDGNPTGILKDAATDLVERVMPPPSPEEQDRAMEAALREAATHGVTSVQNMADSANDRTQPDVFREFQKFEREGKLTVRIYESMPLRDWKTLADLGVVAPFGNPGLRIGNLKEFADGALGSETAWMDEPFANHPGYSGISSADLGNPEGFYDMLRRLTKPDSRSPSTPLATAPTAPSSTCTRGWRRKMGLPIAACASSTRSIRMRRTSPVLASSTSSPPCSPTTPSTTAAGPRPIGPERIKTSYAWKSLLDSGATLAFGSDWPVAPLDPVMGIYAAVTRRTLDGKNPGGWVPEQRITVAQAVHAYTMGSAFAEHQEAVKGSIQPGKLPDLVVLSDDIFTIPPESIEKTKVDMTIFDGRIVYERK